MISDKGADSPAEKFIDLYPDGHAHMARKPIFLKDMDRMIIVFQKYDKYEASVVVAISDDNGDTWKKQVLPNCAVALIRRSISCRSSVMDLKQLDNICTWAMMGRGGAVTV